MSPQRLKDTTQLLNDLSRGQAQATDELMVAVYDELRVLAAKMLRQQRAGHTLQPSALVNEAYLRLVDQKATNDIGRTHFFNVGAMAMRQILADYARRRGAAKRGGDLQRVSLGYVIHASTRSDFDLICLHDALTKLEQKSERQVRIVELRFLAGMSIVETANALGVSPRTVELDWRMARAWLRRQLSESDAS